MDRKIAIIGFGEAGRTFATAGNWGEPAGVYDRLHDEAIMHASMVAAKVTACDTMVDALSGAPLVLSLVTADQAPLAAQEAAQHIAPGTIFCDMNSIAPQTKQANAAVIEGAGAHYVDVAVMAPVDPAALNVPLLVAGDKAAQAKAMLEAMGFAKVRIAGDSVGSASSIKMIRSVMVKGMEALTAECVLAAEKAGVLDEVLSSLDASEKPKPWAERADYNLDRMMIHGERRAAEMEEVVKTLEGLGTGAMITRGTVVRQRTIGEMGYKQPANSLERKIEQVKKGGVQTA
ncbi:MAG: NAD(P)-dependent oxidoreductase [Sphingobium sp.]|nr:NAD(P)-dependent oxidoreductase [Sphingobium sp.]